MVDTVPFGAFRRSLVEQVGLFDESLLTNEDYEFNVRVRDAGRKVWFDPAIRSAYFARSDLVSLARQYWRYGYWKARMLRRYPDTFRWRQLAGIFVFSFFTLSLMAIWFSFARGWLLVQSTIYLLALLIAGFQIAARKKDPALVAGGLLAIACMHFAWGSGFIWSMIRATMADPFRVQKSKRWRLRPRERRTLLLIGDFAMALMGLLVALYVWASAAEWLGISLEFLRQRPPGWFYILSLGWMLLLVELRDVHRAADVFRDAEGSESSALPGC